MLLWSLLSKPRPRQQSITAMLAFDSLWTAALPEMIDASYWNQKPNDDKVRINHVVRSVCFSW